MYRTKMLTLLILGGSASAVFAQSSVSASINDSTLGCCLKCWDTDSRKPGAVGGIAIESTRVDGVVASTATSVNVAVVGAIGNGSPATIGGISIQASDVKGRLSAITITTNTADTVVAGRENYPATKLLSQHAEPLLENAGVGENKQSLAEAAHSIENARPLASDQGKDRNLAPLVLNQIYAGVPALFDPAPFSGIVFAPIKLLQTLKCRKTTDDGPVLAAPAVVACLGGITIK